jgi:hypothetical protein
MLIQYKITPVSEKSIGTKVLQVVTLLNPDIKIYFGLK